MKSKTCCFTGHREYYDNINTLKENLIYTLEMLISDGFVNFCCGGAIGFDTLAAETVIRLKETYPHIKLIIVIPCKNQTMKWSEADINRYNYILSNADKTTVLSQHYYRGCMHVRNRYMVDMSSVCICYKRKSAGGTAYTHNYALSKHLKIIEL